MIFSPDLETHVKHIREVLQRYLDHQLHVKDQKCEFHLSAMSFLGYIIYIFQINAAKIQAVIDWPTPTSRHDAQKFLGFANFYQKSIRDFSVVAALLYALNSVKFQLSKSPQAEQAFQDLKR